MDHSLTTGYRYRYGIRYCTVPYRYLNAKLRKPDLPVGQHSGTYNCLVVLYPSSS